MILAPRTVVVALGISIAGCAARSAPPPPMPPLWALPPARPEPAAGTRRVSATVFEIARVSTEVQVRDTPATVLATLAALSSLAAGDELMPAGAASRDAPAGADVHLEYPSPTDSGYHGTLDVAFGPDGGRATLSVDCSWWSAWAPPRLSSRNARARVELDLAPGRLALVSVPSEPDRRTTFVIVLAVEGD